MYFMFYDSILYWIFIDHSTLFFSVCTVNPKYHKLIYEGEENLSKLIADQRLQKGDDGSAGAAGYSVPYRPDQNQEHVEPSAPTMVSKLQKYLRENFRLPRLKFIILRWQYSFLSRTASFHDNHLLEMFCCPVFLSKVYISILPYN